VHLYGTIYLLACRCVVQDSRTALHETCRSQSDAEQDLHDIAKLLTDAGAELDSKAVDAGEVCRLSVTLSSWLGIVVVRASELKQL